MTPKNPNDQLSQFKQVFFDECAELLEQLSEGLVDLEPGESDKEKLNTIFRAVHSIKAGAGAFKFARLVSFSHTMETVLDRVRTQELPLTREIADVLIRSSDILSDLVSAAQTQEELPDGYETECLAELNKYVDAEDKVEPSPVESVSSVEHRVMEIEFRPGADLFISGNDPLLMARELSELGTLTTKIDTSKIPHFDKYDVDHCYCSWTFTLETEKPDDDILEVFEFVADGNNVTLSVLQKEPKEENEPAKPASPEPETPPSPAKPDRAAQLKVSSIRVDLERVDRLVNVVGELVIAQSMVMQDILSRTTDMDFAQMRSLEDFTFRTRELQEGVMAIRMQAVKSVFSRMPRIVREISKKLDKKIRLEMSGERTEVDKTVIEELADPLVHMIRNALDHGIEMPDVRRKAGKPEEGCIHLSAEHRGGRIVITIEDDGKGIDVDAILSKAIERALVTEEGAKAIPEQEIYQFIFAPGFSMAAGVSDISGRGVGMDVVRQNILNLGGRVSIESELGKGTKFTLTLPLTLAVLDGMLIAVGPERYIVPVTSIIETLRPEQKDVRRLSEGFDVLTVRGEVVPLIYIYAAFGLANGAKDPCKGLVIVVETETGRKVGLVVNELIGQQQVVIKSLEENYDSIKGVSGATILGDGKVALILDVDGLSTRGFKPPPTRPDGSGEGDDQPSENEREAA